MHSSERFAGIVLVASLVLFSRTAHAQGDASADQEAQARFTAGEIAFSAGRFEDALGDFQRAFELSARPELLYNIGLAADRLRDDELALESFDRFIELLPDHPSAEQVRGRVQAIRGSQRSREGVGDNGRGDNDRGDDDVQRMAPNPDPDGPSRAGVWALGLGGGAFAIGGAILVALALSDKNEIESIAEPVPWPQIESQVGSVPRRSGAGIALISVGAAAAFGAVLWRVMTPSGSVNVAVGAGSVAVEGRF